ncbi:MAG: hypothetical protein KF838_12200 [Phycisphaeraceae bacterium]|nr:MAG: hypothetical protein KF838_12200 [Phycisphaeraceae bacterium]
MLLLSPRTVSFGDSTWANVALVTIDREASRSVIAYTDTGPHPTFVDAPEQVTRIKIVQELASEDLGAPRPGEVGMFELFTSPTSTNRPRTRLAAEACVESVTHEVSLKRGAVRTITLIALSTDGATDPIATEPSD